MMPEALDQVELCIERGVIVFTETIIANVQ